MKKIFLTVAVVMLVVLGTYCVGRANMLSFKEASVQSSQTGHAHLSQSGGDFDGDIALGKRSIYTNGSYQVTLNSNNMYYWPSNHYIITKWNGTGTATVVKDDNLYVSPTRPVDTYYDTFTCINGIYEPHAKVHIDY